MNQKGKIKATGIFIVSIWLLIGMFLGVSLYIMLTKPILSILLNIFGIGLCLIDLFLIRCYNELKEKKWIL